MGSSVKIFLCYARKDSANVKALYRKLTEAGFDPWMDVENLLSGEDWMLTIKKAIQKAPFFLACLSRYSTDHRGIVQVEIKEALEIWRQKLDDDIYLIPVRLENCEVPYILAKFHWVDLFTENGFPDLIRAIREGMRRLGIVQIIRLRSIPTVFSSKDTKLMIQKRNFHDQIINPLGKGIHATHQYELIEKGNCQFIIDHTTGLVWQRSGSPNKISFNAAKDYIQQLNLKKFAGHNDWRLPTLEEAMSLIKPEKDKEGLYIDSLFANEQEFIWTDDCYSNHTYQWVVFFNFGRCIASLIVGDYYVRAVRSDTI